MATTFQAQTATTANDFLPYSAYEPTDADMREWNLAMGERDTEDEMSQDWAEEADAATLRDAGYGTDEDYGYYGSDDC